MADMLKTVCIKDKWEVAHIWGTLSFENRVKYGSSACLYEECQYCGKVRFAHVMGEKE